jgi:hypothetical protein
MALTGTERALLLEVAAQLMRLSPTDCGAIFTLANNVYQQMQPEPDDGAAPTEAELKQMMQDPRYWKKHDPAFIELVSAGLRRLYGEDR